LKEKENVSDTILNDIAKYANEVTKTSELSMKALLTSDILISNDSVERVQASESEERRLTQKVLTYVKDVNAAVSLRTIVLNLGQINKYCRIIGEVTINRILERPTDICDYVPLAEVKAA